MGKVRYHRSAAVIQVSDVIRSAEFYRDMFGFNVVNTWGSQRALPLRGGTQLRCFSTSAATRFSRYR